MLRCNENPRAFWLKGDKFDMLFSGLTVSYLFFFLVCFLESRIMGSITQSVLLRIVILILFASCLAVYRFHNIEIMLLVCFCLWMVVTRIIFGELLARWTAIAELSLMVPMFAVGLILKGKTREHFLFFTLCLINIYYCVFGIACIYTAATRSCLIYPVTGAVIGYDSSSWRIAFLNHHWNQTAGEFLIALCISLVLIFRAKRIWIKILFIIGSAIYFTVIALTISRNGQTWASLAVGLSVGLVVFNKIKCREKLLSRVFAFIVTTLAIMLLVYQLNEPIRKGLWNIYESNDYETEHVDSNTAQNILQFEMKELTTTVEESDGPGDYREDTRPYLKSGRKEIYWSAIKSLQLEPRRILIGSPMADVMDISNSLIEEQAGHFHNLFLQVINQFGLPALILVLLFLWRVFRIGMVMIINKSKWFQIKDQSLIIPIIALLGFNMLEVGSFTSFSFIGMYFFFACGILTGVYEEIATEKEGK